MNECPECGGTAWEEIDQGRSILHCEHNGAHPCGFVGSKQSTPEVVQ